METYHENPMINLYEKKTEKVTLVNPFRHPILPYTALFYRAMTLKSDFFYIK